MHAGRMRACVQLCLTLCGPRTMARQAPLSMGILQARILEWVAFPPPGDLPDPGTELVSLASPALAGRFFTAEPPNCAQTSPTHCRTVVRTRASTYKTPGARMIGGRGQPLFCFQRPRESAFPGSLIRGSCPSSLSGAVVPILH